MRLITILFLSILSICGYTQNSAISFDGSSTYIQVTDNNAIDLSGTLTIEAWIYPTGAGSQATQGGVIINKENSFEIARFTDGTINFALSANGTGSDWAWVNTSLVAPLNQWSHIAFVKSGVTVTLYLNSSSNFTNASQPAALAANTQNLRIGARTLVSHYFNGRIEEVRFWNTARTQAEVKANMFNQNLSPSASGLVAYYRMNEGSGVSVANSSNNFAGLNGTLNSGTWIASPVQYGQNALSFDGIDDLVTTPLSISGLSAFTLEGWIYPRTAGNRIAFFGQNDAIEFGFSSSNTINAWTLNGSNISWTFDNTTMPLNTWHHVAFVGTGTSIILYVDGVQRATGAGSTANYGTSGDKFNIGAAVWDNAGNQFDGVIDEVRVWNIARTQTQIQNNRNNSVDPVTSTGLVAYYWFNEGINTGDNTGLLTVTDRKGSNNGTLTNFSLINANTTSNFIVQNSVLPLRWTGFDATLQGEKVVLKWNTADELNTKEFIVQHSVNGITWRDIGNIPAVGTGHANYSFTHTAPEYGINYYRVQEKDIDDRLSYSSIRSIRFGNAGGAFSVLSNPVNAQLYIQVKKETAISLFNYQGQLILSKKYGVGNHMINVAGYAKGIYLLKSIDYSEKIMLR